MLYQTNDSCYYKVNNLTHALYLSHVFNYAFFTVLTLKTNLQFFHVNCDFFLLFWMVQDIKSDRLGALVMNLDTYVFAHFSFSSQLLLQCCMHLNET